MVLKNRAQTLLLCRLMVRAEDRSSRTQLLHILQRGETACLRLFLDYHGLRLIWSWMMDPATDSDLKIEVRAITVCQVGCKPLTFLFVALI